MSDWPGLTEQFGLGTWAIGPSHPLSLGTSLRLISNGSMQTSTAWPAANLAKFIPFRLPRQGTAYQMGVGLGATSSGSEEIDLGIYDEWGNRLVSAGATASTGLGIETVLNITDTVIGPGLFYMALSANLTTRTMIGASAAQTDLVKCTGVRQVASAHALPATATLATVTDAFVPAVAVWLRSE